MPSLDIGNKRARLPIVQGGMGVGISLSRLASAVADEGGIGVIAANAIGMIEPDYRVDGSAANVRALRKEIRRARELSQGLIGVNLMVATNDFHLLLDVVIEERPDIVFLGAGLPLKGIPVEKLREAQVMIAPIVSSARAVELIFRFWEKKYHDTPDAVVVEGPAAGGHLGFDREQLADPECTLDAILPGVVSALEPFEQRTGKKIPVIAAGGIYTGEDIHRCLRLGASGIQMGTRFVVTHECDADIGFKQAYLDCREEDITLIDSPVGMIGRAIRNRFLDSVGDRSHRKERCPWRCLASCNIREAGYCISEALDNARQGRMDAGYAFAGANAFRATEILSVRQLMTSLQEEFSCSVQQSFDSLRAEYDGALSGLMNLRGEYAAALGRLMDEYEAAFDARMSSMKESATNYWANLKESYEQRVTRMKDAYQQRTDSWRSEYTRLTERAAELRRFVPERLAELEFAERVLRAATA